MRERKIESFYARLRVSVSVSSSSPLLIFPSTSDCDSICALKIIFQILQSDSVRYACYPVSSFKELHTHAGSSLTSSSDNPVSVLLINWGCHRDLRRVLHLGSSARIFVLDSHRPIHLHNLSEANDRVIVLYTEGDEHQADLSCDFDVSALANGSSDLNSDDECDSKDEEEEDGSESDDNSEADSRKKRSRVSENEEDPVQLYQKLKKEYYQVGTFHGKPSGFLMYELSHSLRKNTKEALWLACVSLADQFVHDRLTRERYQSSVMELEQHINSCTDPDAVTSVTLKDGTKIRAPDSLRILYGDEPRLMLLQEWTLFDSMMCSSSIATKLKTWSDNGVKKLKFLLARMGFALIDCQQKFQYMNIEVKKKMKDEFQRFLPEYGIDDFYYKAFLRMNGYSSRVSAADAVYGVTALLESSEQFGGAYDALAPNNMERLRKGMQMAIRVQRAIVRQGSAAIMRYGSIRSGRKFRWVKLEDAGDTELLGYPLALTRFCYFLMDAMRERGAKMKPLLCACFSHQLDKMLVVGVCAKPRLGAVRGNAFGLVFRRAAEETGAGFFDQLFDSSWILLDSSALNSFMINLTHKL